MLQRGIVYIVSLDRMLYTLITDEYIGYNKFILRSSKNRSIVVKANVT